MVFETSCYLTLKNKNSLETICTNGHEPAAEEDLKVLEEEAMCVNMQNKKLEGLNR